MEHTGHHEASRCYQEWRREGARQKLASGDGFQEDWSEEHPSLK